jgi:predicted nucleotidyltransferase
MRLSKRQREIIERTAIRHFGKNVRVYLFGSRANHEARGGDIDLYLEAVPEYMITVKKKIAFIVGLKKYLGDQKIDVIFKSTDNSSSRFQQIIEKTKVPIN